MVRRGERRRGAAAQLAAAPRELFRPMKRKFAPSTVLGEEQTHEVHRLSMRILSEIGVTFHAQSAWDTLEAKGCAVDRETGNVRFDPAAVEHFVAMAPGAFDMAARDSAKTVHFGGDSIVWGSASSAPNVLDQERGPASLLRAVLVAVGEPPVHRGDDHVGLGPGPGQHAAGSPLVPGGDAHRRPKRAP